MGLTLCGGNFYNKYFINVWRRMNYQPQRTLRAQSCLSLCPLRTRWFFSMEASQFESWKKIRAYPCHL